MKVQIGHSISTVMNGSVDQVAEHLVRGRMTWAASGISVGQKPWPQVGKGAGDPQCRPSSAIVGTAPLHSPSHLKAEDLDQKEKVSAASAAAPARASPYAVNSPHARWPLARTFHVLALGCSNVKRAPASQCGVLKCRRMQLQLRNDGRAYPVQMRSAVCRCEGGRTNEGQSACRAVS
jgi:hypothetical protein